MLSPQGRYNATYNEHIPMKELHTAMRPACPVKFPYRPPKTGSGCETRVEPLADTLVQNLLSFGEYAIQVVKGTKLCAALLNAISLTHKLALERRKK